MVWGWCGDGVVVSAADIPEAPYLLETMIDGWDSTPSPVLRVELLSGVCVYVCVCR